MRDAKAKPIAYSIGSRVQNLPLADQAIVLARLVQSRQSNAEFSPKQVEALFREVSLPLRTKISNILATLAKAGLIRPGSSHGAWRITPNGRQRSLELFPDLDLAALIAEAAASGSLLGHIPHPTVLPTQAPPGILPPVHEFLKLHPFETNVFGMTRFPDKHATDVDPIAPALAVARDACRLHGLEFHLASDRQLDDDLWGNVAAHMWASRYGIAFFEDARKEGLNYNLAIEVGSMLMTGRRCALLKDKSSPKLPTDLVGYIYKSIDLAKPETVAEAIHDWIAKDLALGRCAVCPKEDTLRS